ncbi:hypothetical protein FACS1894217_03510 [Clostridia bacterium]|nr:hypothetical protein FACS1894217_03510 [Clostridia bacterium]
MKKLWVFIAIIALLTACSPKEPTETIFKGTLYFGGYVSFAGNGIIEAGNGPMRFSDLSGDGAIVLCDKPDCKHEPATIKNPTPTCLAQTDLVEGQKKMIIYQNHQILIRGIEGEPMATRVYTADINGENRKKVADIPNALNILSAAIRGDTLVLAYQNSYEVNEAGLFDKLEKDFAGISIVNMKTRNVKNLIAKEGYSVSIDSLWLDDKYVGYSTSQTERPFEEYYGKEFDGDYANLTPEMMQNAAVEAEQGIRYNTYLYDVSANVETEIWNSNGRYTNGSFADGYWVTTDGEKATLTPLNGEESIKLKQPTSDDFSPLKADEGLYFNSWKDDVYTYYSCDKSKFTEIGHADFSVATIINNVVYASRSGGEFAYGYLPLDNFKAAKFDAFKVLIYPNRKWVG